MSSTRQPLARWSKSVRRAPCSRVGCASRDSRLFFLASAVAGGGTKSLYTVTPAGPSPTVPVSAISDPSTSDDVLDYSIAANQSSILIHANRGGRQGLFFIDARQLQTETQVSHTLAFGESIDDEHDLVDGWDDRRRRRAARAVTPFVLPSLTTRVYVAEVSATPIPARWRQSAQVVGLRPDDGALLFTRSGQVFERDITGGTDTMVAAGGTGVVRLDGQHRARTTGAVFRPHSVSRPRRDDTRRIRNDSTRRHACASGSSQRGEWLRSRRRCVGRRTAGRHGTRSRTGGARECPCARQVALSRRFPIAAAAHIVSGAGGGALGGSRGE